MGSRKFVEIRENLGLTQKQIADSIGTTVQTVSNWETGSTTPRLTFTQTYQLTKVLKKDLKELCKLFE